MVFLKETMFSDAFHTIFCPKTLIGAKEGGGVYHVDSYSGTKPDSQQCPDDAEERVHFPQLAQTAFNDSWQKGRISG